MKFVLEMLKLAVVDLVAAESNPHVPWLDFREDLDVGSLCWS